MVQGSLCQSFLSTYSSSWLLCCLLYAPSISPKDPIPLSNSPKLDFNPANQPPGVTFHSSTVNPLLAPPYPTSSQDSLAPIFPFSTCLPFRSILLQPILILATLINLLMLPPPLWEVSGADSIVQVHVPFSMPDLSHIESKLGSFSTDISRFTKEFQYLSLSLIYHGKTYVLLSSPIPPQNTKIEFSPRLLNMLMIWSTESLHTMLLAMQQFP